MALMPICDAMVGRAGGSIVESVQNTIELSEAAQLEAQAQTAFEAAEANYGQIPDGELLQQYQTSHNLRLQARNIRAKARGM